MTNLHKLLNPISREERVKINENWDRIMARFNNLQYQINFLSGEEVDVIIDRIETTIANAQDATVDAQTALNNVNDALAQLTIVITDVISATNAANNSSSNANVLIGEMRTLKGQLETLQTDLTNIVQAENVRVTNENTRITNESIRENNEAQRIQNEDNRLSNELDRVEAEQSRTTVFDSKMLTADEKIDAITGLIDGLESFAFDVDASYDFPNLVAYNGSTFIVLQPITGIIPINDGVNYRLVAQRGVDGTGAVSSVNGNSPDGNGDVIIPSASVTASGLMSSSQYIKLSTISSGANFVQVEDSLTSISPTSALSAKQGNEISNQIGLLTDRLDTEITAISDTVNDVETQLTEHLDETKYETVSRTIYVSVTSGDDNNGDGSVSKPYRSITKSLASVNKNIASIINIRVAAGDYRSEGNINIKNYRGTYLMITAFDGANEVLTPNDDYLVDRFTLYDSSVIYLQGFKTHTATNYGIYISACPFVKVTGYKNVSAGSSGLGCTGYSCVWVENSTVSNVNTAVSANQGAKVITKKWINSTSNMQGIVADNGAQVHLSDDTLPNASNQFGQINGGVIFDKNGDLLYSPQFIGATRDVTVTGIQTINVTGTPKLIRVRAFVNQTKKRSDGSWAKNAQGCIYVDGTDANLFDGTGWAIVIEDSAGNYTTGAITNVQKNSFDINWTKGGSGGSGTVRLQIEVICH